MVYNQLKQLKIKTHYLVRWQFGIANVLLFLYHCVFVYVVIKCKELTMEEIC